MKKLYKYLEKIGAAYQRTECGANYFYNAPALHFDGALIVLSYDNNTDARRSEHLRRVIERYAARYHYTIFNRGGYPGTQYFSIMRADEKAALDFYLLFQCDSVSSCENYMHIWETMGTRLTRQEQNDFLKGVMDFHGEEYAHALAEMEKATA